MCYLASAPISLRISSGSVMTEKTKTKKTTAYISHLQLFSRKRENPTNEEHIFSFVDLQQKLHGLKC